MYKTMLTDYPETRTSYEEAFIRYNLLKGNITESEAKILRELNSKCVNLKSVSRNVRYVQKKNPELDYDKEEKQKRVRQEQECRDKYRTSGLWEAVGRYFNKSK